MSQQSLSGGVKNTVSYELYLSKVPSKEIVEAYREHILSMWRDIPDDFELEVDEDQRVCYGSYEVNQRIEREWLIIYMLYDLSRIDTDLVITLQDSDGQILLITAAEEIPKWLESSKSNDRVFIHRGKVHIIPEQIKLRDLQRHYNCSSVTQAAACFIREMNSKRPHTTNMRIETLASGPIQQAVEAQLAGMPDQRAWLSRKYKQLDDILSGQDGMDDQEQLQKKFCEDISLASVMAMDEQDLRISPISSRSSSSMAISSSSSSSWMTEQEGD